MYGSDFGGCDRIFGRKMGTEVVIIGKSGDLTYTADDMVQNLETIGYEVICNNTKRLQMFHCTHGLLYAL